MTASSAKVVPVESTPEDTAAQCVVISEEVPKRIRWSELLRKYASGKEQCQLIFGLFSRLFLG